MNLCSRQKRLSARPQGSAVIVVLVLIMIVGAILIANGRSLNNLRRNLHRIEQKQIRKFSVSTTNVVILTNSVTQPQPAKP
jgi:hypothetical protein